MTITSSETPPFGLFAWGLTMWPGSESIIAEDHLLRHIDRILEMSFVRELTATCYMLYAAGMGRS